jgi:hypothetical protein
MHLTIEDARDDVRATRRQLSETADELSSEVHERVDEAKRAMNPLEYAREYPWAALGIAAALGLGIGLTRADRKAAKAGVRGAKSAGAAMASGAADLASSVKDRAVDLVQHHGSADSGEQQASDMEADTPSSVGSRIRDRVQSSVHDLLAHGLDELLREIRR